LIIGGIVFVLKKSESDSNKSSSSEICGSSHESYSIVGQSKLGKYSRAAVAVDNEECSKIGKSILLKGGKAVDAAIAASLCNGILNAHSMGIGGGCVFLIYSKFACFFIFILFNLDFVFRKRGKAFSIIERESAPLYSNERIFQGRENLSLIGIII
jgi:gamma-glutamyltranspeptidase/glutathione hydrolase/leukotriene-C4 hydrolase